MPTMIGPVPQELGTVTGIVAAMPAPTLDSQGVATNGARFVNVWVGMVGGTSAIFQVFLYRTGQGWTYYGDVPATTVLTTYVAGGSGGLFQLETRGAERVYGQLTSLVGGPTCSLLYEGVTY